MKKKEILKTLLLLLFINLNSILAQEITTTSFPTRMQYLNQYTDIFISPPLSGQAIKTLHNDTGQVDHDRYFYFDQNINYWVEIYNQEASSYIMQPGVGYILQIGGNGNNSETVLEPRNITFSGNPVNTNITTSVTGGKYCELGNPYADFLDLDSFLLDPDNVNKLTGPVYLWAHNTINSVANYNPNEPAGVYHFSANDYALYNILGGVAAGRNINTSIENETYTGVLTPNGKICFGTGFLMQASTTGGTVSYKTSMTSSTGTAQSFKNNDNVTNMVTPPSRSRIWVNIEEGTIPTSGNNFNQLKQLLVGYSASYGSDIPTAAPTDRVFDAELATLDSSPRIQFFSVANTTPSSSLRLAIQGRNINAFTNDDYFQLGYQVSTTGEYTFSANADGMFGGSLPLQNYYIQDLDAPPGDNTFSLPRTFTLAASSQPNTTRFRIVFKQCEGTESSLNFTTSTQSANGPYDWVITNLTTGAVGTIHSVTTGFIFNTIPLANITPAVSSIGQFVRYGDSYIITCVNANGIPSYYCRVNIAIPIINISDPYCDGTTVYNLSQVINTTAPTQVATTLSQDCDFIWEITKFSTNETKTFYTAVRTFTFNTIRPQLPANFIDYNQQYIVRVKPKNTDGTDNLIFGDFCKISTFTQAVYLSACNYTLASQNTTLVADPSTGISADRYYWRITRSDNTIATFQTAGRSFRFAFLKPTSSSYYTILNPNIPADFVKNGTEYCIEISIGLDDLPDGLPFSSPCCVTTPGIAKMSLSTNQNLEVKAYPNPFQNNFMLEVENQSNEPIEITVYDIIGKQIDYRKVDVSTLINIQIGDHFASGVYNVTVSQGDEKTNLKLVKQ